MKQIFSLLILSLLLFSCSEDDTNEGTPVFISTDIMGNITVYSNTYKKITVAANSTDSELSKLKITSFDNQRGDVVLLDSAISGTDLRYEFLYHVPMLQRDSTQMKMTFAVSNRNGYTQELVRNMTVVLRDYKLEEVSGITLYAVENGDHANGLNLEYMRPIIVSMSDSADIDLYTYLDEENPEPLSREWRSNTDIYFARANNFDYANATNRSVTETFGSAVANPRINQIQKDDIILVGRGNRALGVIKVAQLYDESGTENDRYIINVKRIEAQ